MAELVYALCAATSLLCTALLARGYVRSRQRLLLWATLCFAGLFLNNVMTFVDMIVIPDTDLSWPRSAIAFVAVALLAVGLVWEAP